MRKYLIRGIEFFARRRLLALPGVHIAPSAKVTYRQIRLHANSKLSIGEGSIVEGTLCSEKEGAEIIIGANTSVGASLIASATRIEIGDDVLISWGCSIVDHNSHAIPWRERKPDVRDWYAGRKDWTSVNIKSVKIGNKSWLGFNVTVLKGVQIGEGAVVGAGSIVTKDVPPWTIVAGNPAKVIREIPLEDR
jgi:acetyltransferase-like isoleucine patch superfamily enzyme